MILFVTGDTAPTLSGTLTAGTTPVVLTGATLAVHLRQPDGVTITRAGVVTDAAAGAWAYTWQAAELAVGTWACEVQVTYAGGAIQTFPTDGYARFDVRAQLA